MHLLVDTEILKNVVFGKVPNDDSERSVWCGGIVLTRGMHNVEKLRVQSSDNRVYGIEIGYIDDFEFGGVELWFANDRKVYYRPFQDTEGPTVEDGFEVYEVMGGYDMQDFGPARILDPRFQSKDGEGSSE